MTPINITLNEEILEGLLKQDPSMASKLLQSALNELMLMERDQHLNAKAFERTSDRDGYANGFKNKTIKT